MTSAIYCLLWSSVYELQRVEYAFTSPVKTELVGLRCSVCSVLCLCQQFCGAWMCCFEEVYKCVQ